MTFAVFCRLVPMHGMLKTSPRLARRFLSISSSPRINFGGEAILESNSKVEEFYTINAAKPPEQKSRDCPWFQFLVKVNIGEGMISVVSKYGFGLSGSEQVKLTAIQLFGLVTKCIKDGLVTVRLPLLEKDDLIRRHKKRKHYVQYRDDDKLTDFAPYFCFPPEQDDTGSGLADFVEVIYNVLTGNKGILTKRELDLRERLLPSLQVQTQQVRGK